MLSRDETRLLVAVCHIALIMERLHIVPYDWYDRMSFYPYLKAHGVK